MNAPLRNVSILTILKAFPDFVHLEKTLYLNRSKIHTIYTAVQQIIERLPFRSGLK